MLYTSHNNQQDTIKFYQIQSIEVISQDTYYIDYDIDYGYRYRGIGRSLVYFMK